MTWRAKSARPSNEVRIELVGKGLTGEVPAELGGLTALTGLDLSKNKLTSVPAALGGLTALKTLNLSVNWLTGTVPGALGAGVYTRSLLSST
jgi:Leucine-rich repeat (LRR) protein